MSWTVGDVSGLEVLTSADHLHAAHVNELRTATDARAQIAGDLGGTASIPRVKTRLATFTIGPSASTADYVCDGSADDVQIQAAVTALPSTGGRIFLMAGTYNVDHRINVIGKSNVVIEGEGAGNTVIKAAQSIYVAGADHHLAIISVHAHSAPISNIVVRDLTIDANSKLKTQCITVTGGSVQGTASTERVLLENLVLKNMGLDATDTARGTIEIISGNQGFGNYGKINNFIIRNCEFDNSQFFHVYCQGNYLTYFKVLDCYFHDNYADTISYIQTVARTNSDWEIAGCRFKDTKKRTAVGSTCDITDANRTGVVNLKIHHNYFGPQYNAANVDAININLHGSWGVFIERNFFDGDWEAISLGASQAGAFYKINPSTMVRVSGNIFMGMLGTCFDNDSNIFTVVSDNFFLYCADNVLGGYARHWPTVFEGNVVYNAATNPSDVQDYHKAAVETVGDGYIIRDNTFIDDRLLANPTTAPTITQAVGGALGGRTYYAKYTWSNATGQSTASSEATLGVDSGKLATVVLPTLAYPSGATRINIYIGTSSGAETFQGYIDVDYQIITGETDWAVLSWTEPASGLVAGAALPGANTTASKMKYGIYELTGAAGLGLANKYYNNHFYGVETPIFTASSYRRVRHDNFSSATIASGDEVNLEKAGYSQGNVTGVTTFNVINGEVLKATLTGNITVTLTSGDYTGQMLELRLTQDGTGSRTATWPSNFKKAGGTLTLTATVGATDTVVMRWDSTNWMEVSRALNVS